MSPAQEFQQQMLMKSPEQMKQSYKKLFGQSAEVEKAKAGASEELFTDAYMAKNQGVGLEQAKKAYYEKLNKPIKAPDSNSYERKFGPNNANSMQNKFGITGARS